MRGGETGSLPAVAGLIVLSALFWILHRPFGTLGNFANLLSQAGPTDLHRDGPGLRPAARRDRPGRRHRRRRRAPPSWPGCRSATATRRSSSVGAAILTGIVIGVGTGWLCAKIRIPSFVVTLALFLAFQGVVLYLVNNGKGTKGNLTVRDKFVVALENGRWRPGAGWLMAVILVVGYAAVKLWTRHPAAPGRA